MGWSHVWVGTRALHVLSIKMGNMNTPTAMASRATSSTPLFGRPNLKWGFLVLFSCFSLFNFSFYLHFMFILFLIYFFVSFLYFPFMFCFNFFPLFLFILKMFMIEKCLDFEIENVHVFGKIKFYLKKPWIIRKCLRSLSKSMNSTKICSQG